MLKKIVVNLLMLQFIVFISITALADEVSTGEQSQEVTASANQSQTFDESEDLDAEQNQGGSLEMEQSQEINDVSQSQNTNLNTEQQQEIEADDAESAEQNQSINVISKQEQSNNGETIEQNQETVVNAYENQSATTLGNSTMKQTQSVDVNGEDCVEAECTEAIDVEAETKNKIKIIENTVKIIQKIIFNGEKILFNEEFELGNEPISNKQEYTMEFSWGLVYILNNAYVKKDGDNIFSYMESLIRLESPKAEIENYDWDEDGLSNYEEHIIGTDPYKADTDNDGLSDYFEVLYHDSEVVFEYANQFLGHDYEEFKSTSTPTHEIELNPLVEDTDGDGILDAYEDFDEDGVDNYEEELGESNPYDAASI